MAKKSIKKLAQEQQETVEKDGKKKPPTKLISITLES